MSRTTLALALAGLAVAAATVVSGQAPVMQSASYDYRVVTVADGFEHPWAIAFLPGGDMLVTERPGRLRLVRQGRLLPNPIPGTPTVFAQGQGGLLDVVPHPQFASNRLLYLSYSKPNPDGQSAVTAVARGRFENDQLTGVEDIFQAVAAGRGHYGSRLAFDQAGYLFVTAGDRQAPPTGNLEAHPAQDFSNHHGVVIRLHDDGRVPTDNPFVNRPGARPEIWTKGHRNPQGLAIHPETGDIWATEHGPFGGDEVNLIQGGKNYGWPVVGFGVNYRTGLAIHQGTLREGMQPPAHVWIPSIGPSGLMVYMGDRFPKWRGNLFAGGMAIPQLVRLTLDGQKITLAETLVPDIGRVRDVRQGPDGFIYLAIDHDDGEPTPVVRLEPAPRTSN